MKKRDFGEMVAFFNRKVSEMNISQKYKMELLGMITTIQMEHDAERTAKVIPLDKRSETMIGWEGTCNNCGSYTLHDMNYCFECGARLEW